MKEVQERKQGEEPLEYLEEDLEDKDQHVDEQERAAEEEASKGRHVTMADLDRQKKRKEEESSQESGYNSYSSMEEDPAAAEQEGREQQHRLMQENRRLREEKLCKICADREVGVVFVPCGHFACCVNCAPSFSDCPVCRTRIQSAIRTFLS